MKKLYFSTPTWVSVTGGVLLKGGMPVTDDNGIYGPLVGDYTAPLSAVITTQLPPQDLPITAAPALGEESTIAGGFIPVQFDGVDSSAIQTYNQLIAFIDSDIGQIQGVTKTDRGLASNGTSRLYEYRTGNGPINVLIAVGAHGPELMGTWTMLRWFKEFAYPTTPTFRAMRRMFTISWVPSVNPSSFRGGRKNANNVDLNRNYPFYHSKYLTAHPLTSDDNYPGTAPFSEPEAAAIKAIIDERGVEAVLDCHNTEAGYTTNDLLTSPGSFFTRANRRHWKVSGEVFMRIYDGLQAGFNASANLGDQNPTLVNWATHYLHNVKGKSHACAVLIECAQDCRGSTLTNMTSAAVTRFGGYITTWLLSFIQAMYAPPLVPNWIYQYVRFNNSPGTSVTAGGTLIDTAADTPLTWDQSTPGMSGLSRNYIDVPIPCAGYIEVRAEGTIEVLSAATGRFSMGVMIDGVAPTNKNNCSVTTGAVVGDRAPWSLSYMQAVTQVDANYMPRIQITANKLAGASHDMKRCKVIVRFIPDDINVNISTPYW